MSDSFTWVVGIVAAIAGAVASVAGFGIGSIVTPVMSLQVDTKLAVAAVSIPHFIGSAIRCWSLRKDIDRKVLLSFGITSALGGLCGAAVYSWIETPPLTLVFGVILIFAGVMGIMRLNEKLRFNGASAWIAGAISGGLGGLVGNQGGIRSAALLGFELDKKAFIATATAIGRTTARHTQDPQTDCQELRHRHAVILLRCSRSSGHMIRRDPMLMGRSEAAYDALRIYPQTLVEVLRDTAGAR
jgi:uncharacterized membrane protein YfcA